MVRLKSKYPAAPYTYFGVHNITDAREEFLNGDVRNPVFLYGNHFDEDKLLLRLQNIRDDLATDPEGKHLRFLEDRLEETEFLLIAKKLNDDVGSPSEELVHTFRLANKILYGPPNPLTSHAIMKNIQSAAAENPRFEKLWQYISTQLGPCHDRYSLRRPSTVTHMHYKEALLQYAPWLCMDQQDLPNEPVELMKYALAQIGADKLGWEVKRPIGGANARVSYTSKQIEVGSHFKPRSFNHLKQIVAHEVYGHVNRHILSGGNEFSADEAEGVAIAIEQLTRDKFSYKRTLRYLAVSIGWGAFGEPKDFRDTFEIVWRAAIIIGKHSEQNAKQRAFNECVRAFRGGHPNVPGAVFTKDTVYVDGNMRVWQWLEENMLPYEDFVDVLEGRRMVEA
jgi:hypothetical protein